MTGRPTLLDALTKDLEASNVRPDRIVISGDFVSTGSREEYGLARGFLELLQKTYGLKPEHFLIVPGNHDVTWTAGPDAVSRGEYEVFLSAFFHVPVGDTEPARMIDDDLAIVGLDTTSLLRQSASGIGLIGPDQLRAAERLLASSKNALRILVVHHHLLPVAWIEPAYPTGAPSLTLDSPAVLSWAQENGIAMILHGHQHQSYLATFHFATKPGGPLLVAGAPSAAARDLPPQGRNGYHIIQADARNITISVRELTEELRFVEARRQTFVREATGTFSASAIPTVRGSRDPSVDEVRALTRNAAEKVRRVVSESFGPAGGLRIVADLAGARHVRDGLRILDSLGVDDPVQNRIFAIARELARSVSDAAGDGRKTALLLWSELVSGGLDALQSHSEQELIRGLAAAVLRAVDHLRAMSKPMKGDDVVDVASFAAGNQRTVGAAVARAMKEAGKEGLIWIRRKTDSLANAKTLELSILHHTFDALKPPSWFSEVAPTGSMDLIEPAFILCEGKVTMRPLIAALERLIHRAAPVVVVARGFDDEALATMATNIRRNVIVAIPLRAEGPRNEGVLDDLSVLTGARIFNPRYGHDLEHLTASDAGATPSAFISADEFRLTPGAGFVKERVQTAVDVLRTRSKGSESPYEKELLQARLARLVGAVVMMDAVGVSDQEAEMWMAEVSDALHAASGAALEGIIEGGGRAYTAISEQLVQAHSPDEGTRLLSRALLACSQILNARGVGSERIVDSAKSMRLALTLASDAATRTLRTRTVEVSERRDAQVPDDSND